MKSMYINPTTLWSNIFFVRSESGGDLVESTGSGAEVCLLQVW